MSMDVHKRANRLILESRVEGISAEDRSWLEVHLETCPSCGVRARAADETIRSLRSVPVRLNPSIVEATRIRVQARARQLHSHRFPPVWLCVTCGASWAWIAIIAPWLWKGFAWAAGRMSVPSPLWQMGFALWWAVPALLAAGALSVRSMQGADAVTN